MKKQLKTASDSGAPLAVIIGPDEMERNEAAVKVLAGGVQESVSFEGLADRIMRERENGIG